MARKISLESVFFILSIILPFLLINFNEKLGIIFGMISAFSIGIYLLYNRRVFPFESDLSRAQDFIIGAVGYGSFIVISTLIIPFLTVTKNPLNSVFSVLQSTTPILASSQILTLISWGVIIPFVESIFFFGILYSIITDRFNARSGFKNWAVIVLIAVIFTLFHLTTRALAPSVTGGAIVFDNVGLLLTGIFAVVSLVLVNQQKELTGAVYLHVIVNSVASLQNIGIIKASLLGG